LEQIKALHVNTIFIYFSEWRENRKLYEEQLKTGKNSKS